MRALRVPPDGGIRRRWLHLFALSGFVVAQPLYDLLSRNPEVFVVRKSGPLEIILLCLVLSVLLPTGLFLLEAVAAVLGRAVAWSVHLAILLALTLLGAFPALRQLTASTMVAVLGAGVLSTIFIVVYHRLQVTRTFVSYLSAGSAVFPLVFLIFSPILNLVFLQRVPTHFDPPKLPGLVVVVIFDEFPLMSLLNEKHRIDAVRYPNFSRLAATSTWYPNAVTVSGSTASSVASILTGRRIPYGTLPLFSTLPDNLFTLMAGSGPVLAYEAATTLCPPWLNQAGPSPGETFRRRTSSFIDGLKIAYLSWVLPPQWRSRLPPISDNWARFVVDQEEGLAYQQRALGFERFVMEIGAEGKGLRYMHTFLPHLPWAYLPDSRTYAPRPWDTPGLDLAADRWSSDAWLVDQGFRRHLLQVRLADSLLGKLINRLESLGLFDSSLLVISADHGCSFIPGQFRRQLVEGHSLDILNVPLLIKAPGQTEGIIDSVEMNTIDILPVMAQILDYGGLWRTDGSAPSRDADRPVWPPPDWPGESSLERKLALFGSGSESVPKTGFRQDLLGTAVSELAPPAEKLEIRLLSSELLEDVDLSADFLPLLLRGTIRPMTEAASDLVAIAVNDRICSVTRPYDQQGDVGQVSVLLSPEDLLGGSNKVEAFLVPGGPSLISTGESLAVR